MYDIALFRKSQEDLLAMVEDLQSLMTNNMFEMTLNAMTAYDLLCDLGIRIQEHLVEENRFVYSYLLLHEDPRLHTLAWDFINGENPLLPSFAKYYQKWLKNFHFIFTQDFIRESQQIFAMVVDHIEHENKVLFPMLEQVDLL